MPFPKIVESEARLQKVLKLLNKPKYLLTMNWPMLSRKNTVLVDEQLGVYIAADFILKILKSKSVDRYDCKGE